jgi:RNA polymerase sigma-70 factor (ECF subfamily)
LEPIEKTIAACIKGKSSAQEKLYKQFADKMFGVCMIYTKDYDAAKDVMQEGFVKVFNKLDTFKFNGSFEGWVRRIMVNTALERYRKNYYLYALTDIDDYKEVIAYEDVISDISANDLLSLVHELSPQYQMIFNLYAIEGYSHKEIGEMLEISEGTSKSNLSRARKILQEKVKEHFGWEDDKMIVSK